MVLLEEKRRKQQQRPKRMGTVKKVVAKLTFQLNFL
jgi:hypothetical protein